MPTPPDDATFEDIQYHIYVREKIERGLKDVREGRVLTQEEAERRLSKWLGEQSGPSLPSVTSKHSG